MKRDPPTIPPERHALRQPGAIALVAARRRSRLGHLRHHLGTGGAYAALGLAVLCVLLPMLWIFLISIKEPVQALQMPPVWLFAPTWTNYASLFQQYPFPQYFLNSILVAFISTLVALALCTPAAHSIARFRTGGRNLLNFILLNRMLPPVALVIPLFILIQTVGLFDTYAALIIANLTFTIPFVIWTLLGFFESLSAEIEDAALVDGCNRVQLLRFIVLPMAAPGIMATGIISFVFCWNEFIFALLLSGNNARTLPIGVANFLTQYGVRYGELSAATVLVVLPAILLTFAVRRYLVHGLSLGGVG